MFLSWRGGRGKSIEKLLDKAPPPLSFALLRRLEWTRHNLAKLSRAFLDYDDAQLLLNEHRSVGLCLQETHLKETNINMTPLKRYSKIPPQGISFLWWCRRHSTNTCSRCEY